MIGIPRSAFRRSSSSALAVLLVVGSLGCNETAGSDGGTATVDAGRDAGSRGERDAGGADASVVDASTTPDAGEIAPCVPSGGVVKLACVGDSITFGYDLDPSEAYPSVLGDLLGASFDVGNFGQNGVTALVNGDNPIRNAVVFTQSNDFTPDVVVIQLGTNDSKPDNWLHEAEFEADYRDLIQHYRDLGARVFVSLPPPAYMSPGFWQVAEVIPHVRAVAAATGAPLIDVNAALSGHPEYFPVDGVHPNAAGAIRIAETVADAIRADLCP